MRRETRDAILERMHEDTVARVDLESELESAEKQFQFWQNEVARIKEKLKAFYEED